MAAHRGAWSACSSTRKHRQIVLQIVDRARRIARRRPRQAGAALRGGAFLQVFVTGDAPGDRAHDVERVERRHARARLGDLDARIREPQPFGRGADGEAQQQALDSAAILPARAAPRRAARASRRRAASDPRAASAGTCARPARARRRRGTCGRAPAAGCRRTRVRSGCPAARRSSVRRRSATTSRASSSDTGPISLIGRSSASTRRTRSGCRSTIGDELREAIEPLAPRRRRRPRGEPIDDRQRERRAGDRGCAGRARDARARGDSGSSLRLLLGS